MGCLENREFPDTIRRTMAGTTLETITRNKTEVVSVLFWDYTHYKLECRRWHRPVGAGVRMSQSEGYALSELASGPERLTAWREALQAGTPEGAKRRYPAHFLAKLPSDVQPAISWFRRPRGILRAIFATGAGLIAASPV